jgi:hypothetical protein
VIHGRRNYKDKSDFMEYHYLANVLDCNKKADNLHHGKISLSYTTQKDNPTIIRVPTYAKLMLCVYNEQRVIENGWVIETAFSDDLNKTMQDKSWPSYHKFGSMGWGDILIIDRIDLNYTWPLNESLVNFDDLNGYIKIVDGREGKYCFIIDTIRSFNYDGKSVQFTVFYIVLVCVQIAGIIATIGLIQFNGCPYIRTIPRLSLVNSWIVDVDIIIVSLIYLPCFIYAFIGQMFIVLFSMIATNPHFLMEGEFEQMPLRKKIVLITFCVVMFAVHIYCIFYEANYLPYYSLAVYFFHVLDNFMTYNKEFKYVYLFGIYMPKTLLIFYIFYMPGTLHMGPIAPREMLMALAVLAGLVAVILFQTFCHPRFFIKTDYEKELMKLIPKSMLLEDLLKDHEMTDDDVCGICLEPFNLKTDVVDTRFEQPSKQTDRSKPSKSSLSEEDSKSVIDKTYCNHLFHKNCLRAWTEQNENCPICRNAVLNNI